jgi:hypothetical protein
VREKGPCEIQGISMNSKAYDIVGRLIYSVEIHCGIKIRRRRQNNLKNSRDSNEFQCI